MPQGPKVVVLPSIQHCYVPRRPDDRSVLEILVHYMLPKRRVSRIQSERLEAAAAELTETTEAGQGRVRRHVRHRRQRLGR